MYGNNYGYYNPQRYNSQIGVPNQPMNNLNNQYVQPAIQQPVQQFIPSGLQGKIVDDISVVKATDIPMDGSISYFPTADGSKIITKKIGLTGSSEIQVYEPVIEEQKSEERPPVGITNDELVQKLNKLDNSDLLESLLDEMKDLKNEIKELKDNKQKVKEK